MSVDIITAVFNDDSTAGSVRVLALAIADRADEHGLAWAGYKDLARRVNVDRRHVSRLLADAEDAGCLIRLPACRIGRSVEVVASAEDLRGPRTANRYLVVVGKSRAEIVATLTGHELLQFPPDEAQDLAGCHRECRDTCVPAAGGHTCPYPRDTCVPTLGTHVSPLEPSINHPRTEKNEPLPLSASDSEWFGDTGEGEGEGDEGPVIVQIAEWRRNHPGEPLTDDLADKAGELLSGGGGPGDGVADARADEEMGAQPFLELWTAYLGIDATSEAAGVHAGMFERHLRGLNTPRADLYQGLRFLLSPEDANPFRWKTYAYPNGDAFVSDWLTATARVASMEDANRRRYEGNQIKVRQYREALRARQERRQGAR